MRRPLRLQTGQFLTPFIMPAVTGINCIFPVPLHRWQSWAGFRLFFIVSSCAIIALPQSSRWGGICHLFLVGGEAGEGSSDLLRDL